MRRILPSCIVLLALGVSLAACAAPPAAPPGNAGLDTGVHTTGAAGTPLSGGAASVGTRPSGAL